MKKYIKEEIILVLQLLIFYLLPLFVIDPMGLIMIILFSTFILSIILGFISKEKLKFLFSFVVSIIFIPSVFIYYNDSALIYIFILFILSLMGIGLGNVILLVKNRK